MEDKIPIRFHSTAAFVTDIEKAKNFYTSVLGQQIELDFGKNVILRCGITLWEISVQHIIPQKVGADATGNQSYNRFEFYFETEQIEQMVERLKHAGVVFLHLLHEEPWGQRTVRFFDPDRHIIEIGEPLEVFVKRLHTEGLSEKSITEKTGVPIEKVREIIRE